MQSRCAQADLIDQCFNSSEKRLARLLVLMAKYVAPFGGNGGASSRDDLWLVLLTRGSADLRAPAPGVPKPTDAGLRSREVWSGTQTPPTVNFVPAARQRSSGGRRPKIGKAAAGDGGPTPQGRLLGASKVGSPS